MCEPGWMEEVTSGSRIHIVPLTREHAVEIRTWRYSAPYDNYDMVDADPDKLLQAGLGFFAVLVDDRLIGFRSFGPDGRVSGWRYDDSALDTGGGPRPQLHLTGRGLGREVISAGLSFGRARFEPLAFRVTVASFNTRALRTVESLGFKRIGQFNATHDNRSFEVLIRPET
jgi:[ribosomal protein S18]-alanine N-acetyltransferase